MVQPASGGEKNIATGFHAIEFLLWGQDHDPAGPGARPFTDYVPDGGGAPGGDHDEGDGAPVNRLPHTLAGRRLGKQAHQRFLWFMPGGRICPPEEMTIPA
jgi:hypothetical protein